MTEEKSTPRVIKRGQSAGEDAETVRSLAAESEIFTDVLSTGRPVSLRMMTAGDLLYLEKTLGNTGDMERSLKLAARLSVGDGRMSYEDLQRLKMKDLKLVTALLTKAGDAEDEEDDFPND